MKALLIAPDNRNLDDNYKRAEHRDTPLGLYLLLSFLRKHNTKVDFIDGLTFRLDNKTIVQQAISKRPDWIGISAIAHKFYPIIKDLIIRLRSKTNAHITIGGPLATFAAERLLKELSINSVIRGEGEFVLLEFLRRLNKNESLDGLRGLCIKTDGVLKINPFAQRIQNLDRLPFPAIDYFPAVLSEILTGTRAYIIMGSRGCVGTCDFCQVPYYYGNPGFIRRSPENVVKELSEVVRIWGVRRVNFQDSNFLANKAWVKHFYHNIKEQKISGIKFSIFANPESISFDIIHLLQEVGLERVYVGLETGSERRLKLIGKRSTLADNERAVKVSQEVGIKIIPGYMFFYPDSTIDEIEESYQWFRKMSLRKPTAWFNKMDLFFGTPNYLRMKNDGKDVSDNIAHGLTYKFEDKNVENLFDVMQKTLSTLKPIWRKIAERQNTFRTLLEKEAAAICNEYQVDLANPPCPELIQRVTKLTNYLRNHDFEWGREKHVLVVLNDCIESLFSVSLEKIKAGANYKKVIFEIEPILNKKVEMIIQKIVRGNPEAIIKKILANLKK